MFPPISERSVAEFIVYQDPTKVNHKWAKPDMVLEGREAYMARNRDVKASNGKLTIDSQFVEQRLKAFS
jgi:hypothetical protein